MARRNDKPSELSMKVQLKNANEWANGEVHYVKGKTYDVDPGFAEELIATGHFEGVDGKKPAKPKKPTKAQIKAEEESAQTAVEVEENAETESK